MKAQLQTSERRGVTVYHSNPFHDVTEVRTRKRNLTVAKGSIIINAETGIEEGETNIGQIRHVDNEQFVKIFSSSIAMFFDLGAPASKVFNILLYMVQNAPMTDKVYLNPRSAQEVVEKIAAGSKISPAVFHRGVKELADKKVIAHHVDQGWVYINPSVIFNGDRARFYLDLRRDQSASGNVAAFSKNDIMLLANPTP